MIIAIIGGKLQGIETVYLAKQAGYYTILIDSNPDVPASGICDEFVCGDLEEDPAVLEAMKRADFVLPANENDALLSHTREIGEREHIRLAFDYDAYAISSSKIRSDKMFLDNGIPAPKHYPLGRAPYIIKPSGESGSAGVTFAETKEELESFLAGKPDRDKWIAEEYLKGPSYSIEIIGNGREYKTFVITEIHMDDVYDCCQVTAPCDSLSKEQRESFAKIGQKLGELVNLHGIMDVEVIEDVNDGGILKVLEIDARFPSQTPIVVYYSSGINLMEELASAIMYGELTDKTVTKEIYCSYEHYYKRDGRVFQAGEHLVGMARPLKVEKETLGAKVLLSDRHQGGDEFSGIFINWSEDPLELESMGANIRDIVKTI